MAILYVDTDGSGAATPYATWATAAQGLEAALEDAACVAGSTIYMQGAATDTTAASVTLTSAGTAIAPVKIIGCIDGTTNEGGSIVAADLASRAGADLPLFDVTGAGSDIFFGGFAVYHGIDITAVDRLAFAATNLGTTFIDCNITSGATGILRADSDNGWLQIIDCTTDVYYIDVVGDCKLTIKGGDLTTRLATGVFWSSGSGSALTEVIGCDMSAVTATILSNASSVPLNLRFTNSKLKASHTIGALTHHIAQIELVGCNSGTSKAATDTYRDYQRVTAYGDTLSEGTIVRTGGADDGTDSGLFSYALTPKASSTLEGTFANVETPWMSVWVPGGATTATVFIANDGGVDYNEDEAWCEFYSPAVDDGSDYDLTFNPLSENFITPNTTAITDDAVSSWVTATNGQKFSFTATLGYSGFIYAKVHIAKASATPDTVYVDPAIVIT